MKVIPVYTVTSITYCKSLPGTSSASVSQLDDKMQWLTVTDVRPGKQTTFYVQETGSIVLYHTLCSCVVHSGTDSSGIRKLD